MYYDTAKNNHGLPYNPFKALTVPRPIGWISTVSKDGIGNLSPYSYFNGLSYNPPFVMFSAGNRADGSKKDSVLNAESPVHFECKYHQTVELPCNDGFHHVVFGQVIGIHIKDEFITDDGIVDVLKMKVIARLGYNDYTLIEKTFSIDDFKDKGKMTRGWK